MTRATAGFMLRHPARWIALGFGSGLAPKAAGTVGTLWAWVAFLVLDRWLDDRGWALLLVAGFAVGMLAHQMARPGLALTAPEQMLLVIGSVGW